MKTRKRVYDALLIDHLAKYRQMVLVSGPRQVGKTTTCLNHADSYVNWDNPDDRERILAGPAALVERRGPFPSIKCSNTTRIPAICAM
ncbi:MAG TPA: hypothetical protein VMT60_00045 [Candidatus Bathyarchaeia archaeon]|nr:hypothetical protein [Candidatus Bathyarchaeia archaeon]